MSYFGSDRGKWPGLLKCADEKHYVSDQELRALRCESIHNGFRAGQNQGLLAIIFRFSNN